MRQTKKVNFIASKLGVEDGKREIVRLYLSDMSSGEISDYIREQTNIAITPRSIQRIVAQSGVIRDTGDAFRLAVKRGRVQWKYKQFKFKRSRISQKIRYMILKRDNLKCTMCGRGTADGIMLEVDHIVPICGGGLTTESNLQTLCHECNKGKQVAEREV